MPDLVIDSRSTEKTRIESWFWYHLIRILAFSFSRSQHASYSANYSLSFQFVQAEILSAILFFSYSTSGNLVDSTFKIYPEFSLLLSAPLHLPWPEPLLSTVSEVRVVAGLSQDQREGQIQWRALPNTAPR